MAPALRVTKLTMMATTTTMEMGNNDDDGNGATGNGAPGYDNNGDGYGATGDEVFSERTNE